MVTTSPTFKKSVEALEKALILKAMEENNWVISKAARMLDMTERVLSYKIRKYWTNTVKCREQIERIANGLECCHAVNYFNMNGKGAQVEEYIRKVEQQICKAIDAAKRQKKMP